MILEFVLIWMIGKQTNMPPVFWVGYVVWVAYRIIKEMADNAPEMEDE